jgi:Flp pilus assembly protein TadB
MLSAIAIAGWTVAALLSALCIALCLQDTSGRRRAEDELTRHRDHLAEERAHVRAELDSYKKMAEEWQRIRDYSLRRLAEVEQARGKSYRVEVVNLDDENTEGTG